MVSYMPLEQKNNSRDFIFKGNAKRKIGFSLLFYVDERQLVVALVELFGKLKFLM